MGLPASGMLDSPHNSEPSSKIAQIWTSCSVDGRMTPWTARTRLVSRTACSKLPVTPVIASTNRLPNECPPSGEPSLNRYWNSRDINGSTWARATMLLRKSPGGKMPCSRRSRPAEPPSSPTVTMAVMLAEWCLRPRSTVGMPVPPPMHTMRGPPWRKRYS